MRILALDIGETRTGLALSDADLRHATPFDVLSTAQLCTDNRRLREVIEDYEVLRLLIGLPLLADGSEGSQARRVRNLAAKMLVGIESKVTFFDERSSSISAKAKGHELGLSERDMRGKLDSHAAAAFLQIYLDTIRD
jgi:putative Holliday junction resolvase